ncbi:hypothetical protein ACLOJK_037463, partial [Asimina triloba]
PVGYVARGGAGAVLVPSGHHRGPSDRRTGSGVLQSPYEYSIFDGKERFKEAVQN